MPASGLPHLVRLRADFPGVAIDPDKVEISVVQYSGPAGGEIAGGWQSQAEAIADVFLPESFFQCALWRAQPSLTGRKTTACGAGYGHYVSELVRSLDLGESYQALLVSSPRAMRGCTASGLVLSAAACAGARIRAASPNPRAHRARRPMISLSMY